MAVTAKTVTVGATATLIHTATTANCTVFVSHPNTGNDVTFGPVGVVAAAGFTATGDGATNLVFPLGPGDSLYGICASGQTQAIGVTITEIL